MKHTPGPWKVPKACYVKQNSAGEWLHQPMVTTKDDYNQSPCIATISPKAYRKTEKEAIHADSEAMANALLCAAAPDLLEACKKAIDTMRWALDQKKPASGSTDPCVMACQDLSDNLSSLFKAISKAEGGSHE